RNSRLLVRSGKYHATLGAGSAFDALAIFGRCISWNVTNRGFGLILDLLFALARSAPVCPQKAAFAVQDSIEFRVVIDAIAMLLAEFPGALEHRTLNRIEHLPDGIGQAVLRRRRLLAIVATGKHDLVLLEVLRADFDTKGNTAFFPFVEFPARAVLVAIVDLEADSCILERRRKLFDCLHDTFAFFR